MRTPRLKQQYKKEIAPQLKKKLGYTSVMQVPKLIKIVINRGLGHASSDSKFLQNALEELALITGQKAIPTKAKKSISNFKLREGMPIGAKVTLRNSHMYEFLDRFINIVLPRVKNFKGLSPVSFDQEGNYNLGIREQTIFPEIKVNHIMRITGMNITIVVFGKDKKTNYALLKAFGLPFKNMHNSE